MAAGTFIYRFAVDTPMDEVQDSLDLAALATGGLHGEARVRLEARFTLDRERHFVRIEAPNGVGRDLARIFTGLVGRQFGDKAFAVQAADLEPR